MRKHGLWAAAGLVLGLSAWAVGQAPDEDLVDRLHELRHAADRALAAEESEPSAAPRVGPHVLRFLEVGDLSSPVIHHFAPDLAPDAEDRYAMREGDHEGVGTIEELQELVRSSVQPRSWEEGGGLFSTGSKLVVFGTPGLADAVSDYLNKKIRPAFQRFVTVDARVLSIDGEVAATIDTPVGAPLSKEDLARLRSENGWVGGTTASVRTSGRIGQQILVFAGRRMASLTGFSAELGDRVSTSEPVVEAHHDGVALQVTVGGSAARGYAVSLEYQRAALTSVQKVDLRDGPVTRLRTTNESARVRANWSDGVWGVASREDVSGSHRIVLVRVADAGGAR